MALFAVLTTQYEVIPAGLPVINVHGDGNGADGDVDNGDIYGGILVHATMRRCS